MRGCSSATDFLVMSDPFETYNDEVDNFLAKLRPVTNHHDHG